MTWFMKISGHVSALSSAVVRSEIQSLAPACTNREAAGRLSDLLQLLNLRSSYFLVTTGSLSNTSECLSWIK